MSTKGIKNLKLISNVNEIEIQYKFEAKYPKPKNQQKRKNFLLSFYLLFFFERKIKNKLKVKK